MIEKSLTQIYTTTGTKNIAFPNGNQKVIKNISIYNGAAGVLDVLVQNAADNSNIVVFLNIAEDQTANLGWDNQFVYIPQASTNYINIVISNVSGTTNDTNVTITYYDINSDNSDFVANISSTFLRTLTPNAGPHGGYILMDGSNVSLDGQSLVSKTCFINAGNGRTTGGNTGATSYQLYMAQADLTPNPLTTLLQAGYQHYDNIPLDYGVGPLVALNLSNKVAVHCTGNHNLWAGAQVIFDSLDNTGWVISLNDNTPYSITSIFSPTIFIIEVPALNSTSTDEPGGGGTVTCSIFGLASKPIIQNNTSIYVDSNSKLGFDTISSTLPVPNLYTSYIKVNPVLTHSQSS